MSIEELEVKYFHCSFPFFQLLIIFLIVRLYSTSGNLQRRKAHNAHPQPPNPLPVQMGREAVDTGEEGAEGCWETPGGGYLLGKHPANPISAPRH